MKEVFKKIMAAALTMTVLCGGLPAVSGVSTSLITAVTANAEVYSGIEVAGVEITSENADDILGDGVFSYDPLQETITIAGDYTNKELEYDYYTGESLIRATVNCTVVIAEDSVVTIPNGTFIYSSADVTIEGPGSLVLNCVSVYDNHTTGALSIIDADIDIRAGFGDGKGSGIIGGCAYVQSDQKKKCKFYAGNSRIVIDQNSSEYTSLGGFYTYTYNGCRITEPQEYSIVDSEYITDWHPTHIVIEPDEGSFIVEPDNGDNNCCSFDEGTGTLTLSGFVNRNDVFAYANDPRVRYITAERGTIFPDDCSNLFQDFRWALSFDLSEADTSRVTVMSGMFFRCSALKSLDLSSFDTGNVVDMDYMFAYCDDLENLNIRGFDTSKVASMNLMFYNCNYLPYIDLSSFDTSSVIAMDSMFGNCTRLETIYVGDLWSTAKLSVIESMFDSCGYLSGEQGTTYNGDRVDSTYARIDGGDTAPGYLTLAPCTRLDEAGGTLYLYGNVQRSTIWNYPNKKNIKHIIAEEGTVLPKDCDRMFMRFTKAESIDLSEADSSRVTNMYHLFGGLQKMTSVDLSGFDTSNTTNMMEMFYFNTSLTALDLTSFDTSKVKDMESMFEGCNSLHTISVGDHWDTSAVNESDNMFKGCNSLVGCNGTAFDSSAIDSAYARVDRGTAARGYLTGEYGVCFDEATGTLWLSKGAVKKEDVRQYANDVRVKKVITEEGADFPADSREMFKDFKSVETIDLSKAVTNKVAAMSFMFNNCQSMTSIDLSGFNTVRVHSMDGMFDYCPSVTSLDISSFDMSYVEYAEKIFFYDEALRTILVSDDWSNEYSFQAPNIFYGCESLVGGNGTEYDLYYTNINYAVIDTKAHPGLLTAKLSPDITFLHNCSFQNDLSMYYAVPKESLSGYSNIRLDVSKEEYAAGASKPTLVNRTITSYKEQTIGGVVYYMFTFDGITSTDMGSTLSAVLRADKNGVSYSSKQDKYSIKDYAMDRIQNSDSDSFKKMLVDMLNYGAAAQVHFDKNATNLVNNDLTAAQKAMGTQNLPTLKNAEKSTAVSGATATFDKKNVSFENKTVLMYRLKFATDQNMNNVKLNISYKTSSGTTVTKTIPASQFAKSGSYYIVSIDSIAITDVRSVITAKIYDGSKQISNTFQYSIESYVNNRLQNSDSETFRNLVTEMMKFGISAEEHFS